MLNLSIAECPVSWGIEESDDPRNSPWPLVLDEMAAAGYRSVELGPPGYLPSDIAQLREALDSRGLALSAGYVMGQFADGKGASVSTEAVRAVSEVLSALGARTLIVMEAMTSARDATAGRSQAAVRLSESEWEDYVAATHAIAEVAAHEFGLGVAFHPHVATHVEFADEIDQYFALADPGLIGLCLDTGHSVWADVDPISVLDRHGARLRYLHLKDVDGALLGDARAAGVGFEVAVDRGVFCPVGSGIVDYAALRERMKDLAFGGDAAIEQDRTPGRIAGALDDARTSMRFLRDNGFTGSDGS